MNAKFSIHRIVKAKGFSWPVLSVLFVTSLAHPGLVWAMKDQPTLEMQLPLSEVENPTVEGPVWQLTDLIREALSKNPELTAYRERWKAAKARVWQAMSWDDTMAGVDFEGIPRGRVDADRASNQEWMISQKIPFPGKKFLDGRVARKAAQMLEADYRKKELEIVSEVKKAYFDHFLREHEILLHEDKKRILVRLSKSAEARYATGQIPYHEVLRAHTELATITNDVAKHYQQREIALARLKALLGRDPEETLRVSLEKPDRLFAYKAEDLFKLALENQPELQAMRSGIQMAQTEAARAWLDLLPDAAVRLEARKFKGEGSLREYDQFVGVEVPVLSFLKRIGQIKEKRAEKRAAHSSFANMKNMILFEVQNALVEYQYNDRTAKLYESNVIPQTESVIESALAEYEGGRGNFLTVMEAQHTLTDLRHEYYHSIVMREESFAELERVVGTRLEGGNLP